MAALYQNEANLSAVARLATHKILAPATLSLSQAQASFRRGSLAIFYLVTAHDKMRISIEKGKQS
jgi:hypothetical protein